MQKIPLRPIWPALITLGLTSTIAQLTLMREMVAIFYGNELLYGLILSVWLAWVAVGSWGLARLAAQQRWGRKTFALGLSMYGVILPAQIALLRNIRTVLGVTSGAFIEFGPMLWTLILSLAPLCLLGGLLFTFGARLTLEAGGSGGQAYIWESIGAVIGAGLFSFVLIRLTDPFQTALLLTALSLAISAWFLLPARRPFAIALALLFALTLMAALSGGRALHKTTLSQQWDDLVFAADSPYGRLIIQAHDGQRVFFVNGLLTFETQGTFPEEVVHPPLLMHPDPRNVLLVGGGVAGDLRQILKHPIESLTYVEIDPLLIEAARTYLPAEEAAILQDPRLTLILSDGRLFVKELRHPVQGERLSFDVIMLDLPEPSTGALNRFYTREFFLEIRELLRPGGIFSLGLPSAENYWSPELARRNGSVFQTLQAVFPHVLVLPGEHNFFLASSYPLEPDAALLARRLAERGIETAFVTPAYLEYLFTTDRFAAVREDLEGTSGVKLNQDLIPICYYYDLTLWLSRFYPGLRGLFENASLINLGWVTLPLVLVTILGRWQRKSSLLIAVAGIGLVQMSLEVVLLLGFQVLHGSLFNEVTLIVAAFMAGLALGSAWMNHWLHHNPLISKKRKLMFITILMALVLYCGLLPVVLKLSLPAPMVLFPLVTVLAGGLGGSAFPLAVAFAQEQTGATVGRLYGADLIGGCLGASLSAVFLVPLLGIPQTCTALALIGIACMLVMI